MSRIVISDPEQGKAYQIEPEESQVQSLIGLEMGEKFEGGKIGLPNYELKITGGSDQEGFPIRADVRGRGRTKALLAGGSGYNPPREGERQRKSVRGNTVSEMITQINTVIVEKGDKPIEQILGLEPAEGAPEEEGTEEEAEKEPEEEAEEAEEAPEEAEEAEEEAGEEEPEEDSEESKSQKESESES